MVILGPVGVVLGECAQTPPFHLGFIMRSLLASSM